MGNVGRLKVVLSLFLLTPGKDAPLTVFPKPGKQSFVIKLEGKACTDGSC